MLIIGERHKDGKDSKGRQQGWEAIKTIMKRKGRSVPLHIAVG